MNNTKNAVAYLQGGSSKQTGPGFINATPTVRNISNDSDDDSNNNGDRKQKKRGNHGQGKRDGFNQKRNDNYKNSHSNNPNGKGKYMQKDNNKNKADDFSGDCFQPIPGFMALPTDTKRDKDCLPCTGLPNLFQANELIINRDRLIYRSLVGDMTGMNF